MFKLIGSDKVIAQIEKHVDEHLQEIFMILPELKEEIIKNMLWGIFSNESPEKFFTTVQFNSEGGSRYFQHLMNISYSYVEAARQVLIEAGENNTNFFVDSVEQSFKGRSLEAYLDYEDCEVNVITSEDVKKEINKKFEGVIALTLPDAGVVFKSLIKEPMFKGDNNTWLFPYMDIYDEWKYDFMKALYRYTFQVGGHGRWIQNDYNDTYIAQANIDIGDCGSVFLEVREDKFAGYVDMY